MAQKLDGAFGEVVPRCSWIPEAGTEVWTSLLQQRSFTGVEQSENRYTDTIRTRRADDLIPEESEVLQLALKRLSPKEAYDRVFRMRRAFQVCRPHS